MKEPRARHYVMFGLCFAVLAVFLLWPISLTVTGAVWDPAHGGWTLIHLKRVFEDPILREGVVNSFIIAFWVTGLSILIAGPLAWISARYEFPGKKLLSGLVLLPLVLPPFVGAIGLQNLLGKYGSVNAALVWLGLIDWSDPIDFFGSARLSGVIIVEALHLFPIIYLNLIAAIANLDPSIEEAAINLNAGRWMRFRRIIFPLILPGIFAGGTIVFIWSFTELGTPLMFGFNRVTAVQVFYGVQEMESSPRPYALVMVMLTMAVVTYWIGKTLLGRQSHTATTRAMRAAVPARLSGIKTVLTMGMFLFVGVLALLPHIGVVLTSLSPPGGWYRSVLPEGMTIDHFTQAMTHPLAAQSIQNSLIYAGLATVLALILGVTIGYLNTRYKLRGRGLLDGLGMMPLAVPGIVMAFGYVALSLKLQALFPDGKAPSLLQVLGENADPTAFLVIAYMIRRLPYVLRSAVAGLEQVPVELEDAAEVFGSSWLGTMRKIVVPLVSANLLAGGVLAFSFAMLEVSDSLLLAQSESDFPITKTIYTLFERLGDGPQVASALGVWSMGLLALTLIYVSLIFGKKVGSIFRV
jgi:iron(III) transport system permease protein